PGRPVDGGVQLAGVHLHFVFDTGKRAGQLHARLHVVTAVEDDAVFFGGAPTEACRLQALDGDAHGVHDARPGPGQVRLLGVALKNGDGRGRAVRVRAADEDVRQRNAGKTVDL